ncbi:MAG: hypothetical protein ACOC1P_03475 [Minisyncoccales bacterium]
MTKDKSSKKDKLSCECNSYATAGCGGLIYGLGFIGSVIYYVSAANEFFWQGVLGILKSLVWPAFLVYELLKFLGA